MKKPKTLSQGAVYASGHKYGRGSLAFFLLLSILLLGMHKAGNPAVINLRTQINDAVMPVMAVLARPFEAVQSAGTWVAEMVAMRQENIRLKNENISLLQWQAAARELEAENQALRSVLSSVPSHREHYVTARIVSDTGGPYMHGALINAGGDAGVKTDQPIVAAQGLLGRVIEAGEKSARVLLLSDMNSRIPVMMEVSREKSILSGTGTAMPVLSYMPAGSKTEAGERVVTSGDGGVFPPGIPVGTVVIGDNGARMVHPFADPSNISFVRAVDYQF